MEVASLVWLEGMRKPAFSMVLCRTLLNSSSSADSTPRCGSYDLSSGNRESASTRMFASSSALMFCLLRSLVPMKASYARAHFISRKTKSFIIVVLFLVELGGIASRKQPQKLQGHKIANLCIQTGSEKSESLSSKRLNFRMMCIATCLSFLPSIALNLSPLLVAFFIWEPL